MSTRPYHPRSLKSFRRTTAAVCTIAAGLMWFALSATGQEVIYKETFETDGEGSRYTTEGVLVSEPSQHVANGVPDTQLGPAYWSLSKKVSIVGVPGPTPARRAMMYWHHNIDPSLVTPDFLALFDSTVKWLVNNKAGAKVLFSPPPNGPGDDILVERLKSKGYTVIDDDGTDLPAKPVVDLAIHSSSGSTGTGADSRFATYPVPLLTYNGPTHDDVLVSTIGGANVTLDIGDVTIAAPTHPAAGGKTGSFKVVTGEAGFDTIGDNLPEGAIILATFKRPSAADPNVKVTVPFLVLLNSGSEGGSVYGGGPFNGFEGTQFFAGAALNKFNTDINPKTLTLKPIDVTGKKDLKLTIAFAASFLDFETSDYLDVSIDPDGDGPAEFTKLIHFTAPRDADKFFNDVSTNPKNPTKLGLKFQDVTYDLPSNATKLVIKIEALTTWWNEIVGFDNIRVTSGALAPPPPIVTTPNSVTNGLVAYWSFDGNLLDSIKSSHGTARGTSPVAFVDGKAGFGKAIQLNGSNFVEITGSAANLQFAKGSLSIGGWFKVDAFDKSWQALISKGENLNYRIARRSAGNNIAYAGGVGEGVDDVPPITNGWHHFVAVTDAAGAKFGTALYVDGVIRGINTNKAVLAAGTANLYIGENPEALNRQWKGAIDDIALWNRVLTQEEVTGLYNAGTGTAISTLPGVNAPIAPPPAAAGPVELGQTVNGFQDDFTGATRDPNWQAFGPGGDRYEQANGILYVSTSIGDPNHLLYMKPGYSNDVQEVLARIRVSAFQDGHDYPRGGLAVGVQTNTADLSRGLDLHFRGSITENVAPQGRQFKFLDDLRAWGPAGLRTNIPPQTTLGWTNNVWYWLRMRLDPKADAVNDLFGKVWVADGVTPEPSDWQLKWSDAAIPKPLRKGFAGISGSSVDGSGNGLAHLEVDYILIKAAGLPQIKVDFKPTGPAATVSKFTGLTKVAGNKLQIGWVGAGTLEQADSIIGPWTAVPAASAVGIITPAGAGKFYRLKQ